LATDLRIAVDYDRLLAARIDHTALKPDALASDIENLCLEARTYGFAAVCVNPAFVPLCASLLAGASPAVCTVVGFPLGATTTAAKVFETGEALRNGAGEIDMVMPIGMLKGGNERAVADDIGAVVRAAHAGNAIVKVIIETALLTDAEKERACMLASESGADFVKTSTGFSRAGATVADVALMRRVVGPLLGVKAAGGIRTREDAVAMLGAGATRIGASASLAIIGATTSAR
jgi:deoxyribose-phosphate aldolase